MSKQFLSLILAFFAIIHLNAQSITVNAPNGGQTLYTGKSYNITWTSTDVSSFVKLEISADSGTTWSMIADGVNNNGSYSWVVSDDISEKCLLRISDFNDTTINDISDAVFTIKHPFITITSPNGGESYEGCEQQSITWNAGGTGSYARLYYSTNGGQNWQLISEPYVGSSGSESYNWSVPSIETSDFKVRVVDYYDASISDESDATFSGTLPENHITITSPNGGESWSASSLQTISWTNEGTVGNVSIKYSTNNGATWDWVRNTANSAANNIANTGSYQWVVPEDRNSTSTLVQVYEYSKSCNIDQSNNLFTIDNNPAITIEAPNGGQRWYVDRSYTINWSASNLPTNYVTLEYSIDNGQNWIQIIASTSNDGSYSWTIPDNVSSQCLLKVSARDNAAIYDVSNANFTIAQPYISITSPAGGEVLTACTSNQITWEQEGMQTYARVYYSIDGGSNWILIAEPYIGNNKYYNWTVPSLDNNQFRIKVEDYYNSKVKDSSEIFSVSKGENYITLTSPIGGEVIPASSIRNITWTNTGTVGNVSIRYSTNNGATWDWVRNAANSTANNIANTGSYEWLVPANIVSSNCLVQVYQYSPSCIIDYSESSFTIDNSPNITVTYPSGGEKLFVSRSYNIRWSASSLPTNYVSLSYSSDNGQTWNNIINSTSNDGTQSWTVPNTVSEECLMRVMARDDTTIYGIGSAFTITHPYITITSPTAEDILSGCTTNQITWEQEGMQTYARVYYSVDGGTNWILVASPYIGSNKYYNWTVPSVDSDQFRVKVEDYYNSSVSDTSDNFTVTKGSNYLTLTSPVGGESLAASSIQNITWTSTGTVGNVSLRYSTNGGSTWEWVRNTANSAANNIANSGSYEWLLPSNIVSSNCIVQIYQYNQSCIVDYSDSSFTIDNSPTITVSSPDGGEKLYVGRSHSIRWSASSLPTNYVMLDYSIDNGQNWIEIIASTNNDGTHSWTIPNTVSEECIMRVTARDDSSIFDVGNAFTIASPYIEITSPNGGEIWPGCVQSQITWEQEGLQNYVRIYYSIDGGFNWIHIADPYVGSGTSYNWTVPALGSEKVKVRVQDYYNSSVYGTSDNDFTVTKGENHLTLISPNGHEEFSSGTLQEIRWNTTGAIGNVSLKYSTDGGASWDWVRNNTGSAANNISNSGIYTWLVPSNLNSDKCLIQIYEYSNSCRVEYSNDFFTINNNPTITVTAPLPGQTYYFGQSNTIRWSKSNIPGSYVKIEYSLGDGIWKVIRANQSGTSYNWTVPAEGSNNALIRITSVTDTLISDTIDEPFIIKTPVIEVTNPNSGNENWIVGENKNITWNSTGLASNTFVKVEYSANRGTEWTKIADSIPNSGTFIWTIPNISTSSQSYVKVTSLNYPLSKDSNDFAFTITKPIVGVTVPNDGQVWFVGESKSIQWTGMATSENVKIEFSADSGITYSTIIASTANTGQYFWAIPYNTIPSDKCFIKISDITDPTNTDSSDVVFTIAKPTVTLTAPNNEETWYLGQTKPVTWTNVGMSNAKIKVEYSADSGTTWSLIALANNTGRYDWTISSSIIPSENGYVRISDENDSSIKDSNDVAFRMVKPSVTVLNPNGGETLYIGQTKVVTWKKDGAYSPNVRLDYSADNGATWNQITASVVNSESYSWPLTSSLELGNQYLLRIRDAVDTTISDVSNATFTISKPTITVNYPNGGQTLFLREAKNISWQSAALASSRQVQIEYSSDSGSTWSIITTGTANNGAYSWIPSNIPAGNDYLIKISDVLDPTIFDISNNVFAISKPVINITSPNATTTWYQGQARNISWTSGGLPATEYVKIEVSADSLSWDVIANSASNTGNYNWNIPFYPEATNSYWIRIANTADTSIADVSDFTFTVKKPTITLTSPNGGEKWFKNQSKLIRWSSVSLSYTSNVKIEYSADSGSTWTTIINSTPNSGSYNWIIPSDQTLSEQAVIRITSEVNGSISDHSNLPFSIRSPKPGDRFETAKTITSIPVTISDTTSLYSDQYTGTGNNPSGDVFYIFTVPVNSDSVSFTLSANFSAQLHILSANGEIIESSAYGYSYKHYQNNLLPEQQYYVVIEGRNSASGTFNLKIQHHLPAPDLAVQNVTSNKTAVIPGDSVTVSWEVQNIGRGSSAVNWTERIYMQSSTGQNKTLLKQSVIQNQQVLLENDVVSRTQSIKLPSQLTIGDQGVFVVEIIPGNTIQEAPNATANNTSVQATPWDINKLLVLELNVNQITEGSATGITAKISRTGSLAESLAVAVTPVNPARFTTPTEVTIPAGKAAATFIILATDNSLIEGSITDTLQISASGFNSIETAINILDNDKASLSVTELPAEAMEGSSVTFTVNTDLTPTEPLEVLLTSSSQSRFPVPASVTIPAGSQSASITVDLVQDETPEVDIEAKIIAGSANHHSAEATILVQDDDVPGLELIIHTDIISESGGPFATQATLRRTSTENPIAFRTNLSASIANTLMIPSSISLAANELGKTFNIGVIDNNMVDGDREVTITASVFVNSCGCSAPPATSGSVSTDITVTDNDGPTLTLTASQLTLHEAFEHAGTIRVSRNTPTTEALTVNLSSSDTNEATIAPIVTIPVGQAYIDVPVRTKNDGVTDGNKQVYFQATAMDFSTGSVWVIISDRNLPDLHIPSVYISNDTVQSESLFNYRISVKNSGFATAPTGVVVKGYLSKDNTIDASDSLVSHDVIAVSIPSGTTVEVQNAVQTPNIPGNYKLLYWVNPESSMSELLLTNNTATPTSFRINPDYTATAIISNEYFLKGNPIPVTGSATRFNGTVAAEKNVEVYIITNGIRRTVTATTDAAGNYSTQFVPLANEAGYYTAGASFPGMGSTEEQDNFNILGTRINNGQIPQFRVVMNDTLAGTLPVKNMSSRSLTNFTLAPVSLPNGAQIYFDTLASFAGNTTVNISYFVVGAALSSGTNFEVAGLMAKSDEGNIQPSDIFYFCQAPNAHLVADISRLDISASSSVSNRQVEFRIVNKGRGLSGNINVKLPAVNWLSSVTPLTLPSMATGDTAVIILKFSPLEEVPFNYPINGSIAIGSQNGNSLSIPFTFEKVSESNGAVSVSVTNQFTYYSDDAPKVADAQVTIKNYFSGEIYAQGSTDSSGVFIANDLPEGKHKITVEKDKHLPYQGTVIIKPGDTTEANVFLNYQAITFNWSVVPTAIEDQYDITLITQFETHVPMPVVTVQMPKVMPQLSGDEVYAFNVTLTNEGLITANDVAVNLPTDAEYEFITNYEPANLLAQQSIQVPVIMRRRADAAAPATETASISDISEFLGIVAPEGRIANASGGCQDFVGVVYWYTCNISTGLWQKGGELFSYEGRICSGSGGGSRYYFGIGGGGGGGGFPSCAICPGITPGATGSTPEFKTEKKSCMECIDEIISAVTGCVGGPIGDVVGAFNRGRCIGNAATGRGGILECIPLPIPPPISCAIDIVKVIKTCSATSSMSQPDTNNDGEIANAPLGDVYQQIGDELQMVIDAYQIRENWAVEYFGDMVFSDAWTDLGPKLEPFVIAMDSIPASVQAVILADMQGYEIPQSSIQAFFIRWNTSVYAFDQGILQPNTEYPDMINWTQVKEWSDGMIAANNNAISMGYESIDNMHDRSIADLNEIIEGQSQAVCASVKVQFSQQLTMTREAFEGTLEIFNGHPTDGMDSLSVHIQITDVDGVPSNDLFEIQTQSLTNLSDVTGTGAIASQQTGIVKFLFIPELGAALQSPTEYNFGGTVRYWDPYAQAMVTLPLADVLLTVNPSPNLMLHYFMERNILGDDPFTKPEIEPSVPAELAVMVENHGYGPAVNMTISSAQPEIIDNEKGLAIDFSLIGSNFQGQSTNFGVTDINFGTIPALQSRIGQWYFTSSLLGKFVSYEANVVHANSFGNPDLSLVKGVELHELTKSIRAYGEGEDAINDFLVNDIFDVDDTPDIIYFSQGKRTAKVTTAESGSFSSPVSPPSYTNTLTITAADTGWNYIELNDPGNNRYDIVSITRNDGQVIPLNNAWLTFVTLPVGREPVYENKFHFVDEFTSVAPITYTVVWEPRNFDVPEIVSIDGVPEEVTSTQVEMVTVHFNKSIDGSTFTIDDLSLTFQGSENIIDNSVIITQTDSSTFTIDLSDITTGNGFYNLTVQAANIQDTYGIKGLAGKQATWSQFLNVPTVQAFLGIPENRLASSYDTIHVLFNLAIDESSVTPERFTISKDGTTLTGSLTIDSIRTDKKLYYLSGLGDIMTESGSYELTVDLPNIRSADQVMGVNEQSVTLTVDNEGPVILSMAKSYEGQLDPQHVTGVSITFNENVSGFNTASVRLTRNGEVEYLNIAQLSYTDLKNWMAESFGMMTYHEGDYTFTINLEGFTDAIGNYGIGSEQISWTVNRSAVVAVSDLSISPDLGYSDSDGITSEKSVNVHFTLSENASRVIISQTDLSGENVITEVSEVASGAVSIPVTLLTGGNTGIKVSVTGANGGTGSAAKTLYIDQVPLSGEWMLESNQNLASQIDTIPVKFNSGLLNDENISSSLQLRRNGTVLIAPSLQFEKLNDTIYNIYGISDVSSVPGNYQLSISLQSLNKYSSGISGANTISTYWVVESDNQSPVAKAGRDTIINSTGIVELDGTTSYDPDSDLISYQWVAPEGIELDDSTSANPSFIVTTSTTCGTHTFMLIVSDGELFSTDYINVDIRLPFATYYKDEDGDGFGDENKAVMACNLSPGLAAEAGDCNDSDPDIYPGGIEILDNKDNDCNGLIDDDVINSNTYSDQNMIGAFNVLAYPVPTEDQFSLHLQGSDKTETVTVKVYDQLGILMEEIKNLSIGSTLILGDNYPAGLYIIDAVQGTKRTTAKVTKL